MFENPAIQKYMYLQSIAQNQANQNAPMGNSDFVQQAMHPMPQGGPETPIQSGSLKGIEAAKRSLQMDGSENRRALGRALMHFVANKGVPEVGSGFAGALGAINQGFVPALNAYDAERDRIANENFALMKHQEEVERHRRQEELNQMKFMHDLSSHEREYNEMNAYQRAMAQAARERAEGADKEEKEIERADKRKLMLEEKGILPQGAVLFEEIRDKNLRKEKQKDIIERKNRFFPAMKAIKIMEQMGNVVEENPDLYSSVGRIIQAGVSKDKTAWKGVVAGFTKKEVEAANKISKLANDYVLQESAMFPGRASVFIEKIIEKTMASPETTPGAFKMIKDNIIEDNLRKAKDAKKAHFAWEHGLSVPEDLGEAGEALEKMQNPAQENDTTDDQNSVRIMKPNGTIRILPPNTPEEVLQKILRAGGRILRDE